MPIDPNINFRKTTVLRQSTLSTRFKKNKQKYFTFFLFNVADFTFVFLHKKNEYYIVTAYNVCIESCINKLFNVKFDMRRSTGFPSWSSSWRWVCHMEAVDWHQFSSHIHSAKSKIKKLVWSPQNNIVMFFFVFI